MMSQKFSFLIEATKARKQKSQGTNYGEGKYLKQPYEPLTCCAHALHIRGKGKNTFRNEA